MQHRQHRGGLERRTVVAVEDGLVSQGGNPFGQCGPANQMGSVFGRIGLMHFPADDLAAVEIEDQIQVKPASGHGGGQVGHVPAPHLARCRGDVGGRWSGGRRRLGAAPVGRLPGVAQKAVEGRFAGQIDPLVSQHRHDARRR